jgi:hypothetical protein
MSSNLEQWVNYIRAQLFPEITAAIPTIDWGVEQTPTQGWVFIPFHKVMKATPGVVATQGERALSPKTQTFTPPRLAPPSISAPTIPAVNLTPLQVPVPAKPVSWGDQWKSTVVNACSSTIGTIPVIGGYICSGIDNTFGALAKILGDAFQAIYYNFDLPAHLKAIEQEVNYKSAQDFNAAIASIQSAINNLISSINSMVAADVGNVNTALADITSALQVAVNDFYALLNDAIGLFQGLSIPVVQIRNVTLAGFEAYSAGNAPIYWIAVSP